MSSIDPNTYKKDRNDSRESIFHPHFVTCKEEKKSTVQKVPEREVFVNCWISSFKKDPQHLHSPKPFAFHGKPAFNIKAPFESLWWNDNREKGTLVENVRS